MDTVAAALFRALHEEKWLTIKYHNTNDETTLFWIGIRDIRIHPENPSRNQLTVDGLHLGTYRMGELHLAVDRIMTAHVIDGTYHRCENRDTLLRDIADNPSRYRSLFSTTPELKILDYLIACNKLDSTPEQAKDYTLVDALDIETMPPNGYPLSDDQFRLLVRTFNLHTHTDATGQRRTGSDTLKHRQLGMNILSIKRRDRTQLYVLAYRKLALDVKRRMLIPHEEITLCREFTVDGERDSIERYLAPGDYGLLGDVAGNLDRLDDIIQACGADVDNRPYVIAVQTTYVAELESQYAGIIERYEQAGTDPGRIPLPLRAFFGTLTARPRRLKNYPLAILDRNKADLDQMLAIHTAMKYPLTYVQGPPGTGKTTTIVNTIVTAFANDKSVLFSSYNNNPVDGVHDRLAGLTYRGAPLRLPVLRLGNADAVREAVRTIADLYARAAGIDPADDTDDPRVDTGQVAELTGILERHETILALQEKRDAILALLAGDNPERFAADLSERQLSAIDEEIAAIAVPTEEEARAHLPADPESLARYLYYHSARHLQRLKEPKYEPLRNILAIADETERAKTFTRYIANSDNFALLLRIFPIILTTDISAAKLGGPHPWFDLVILDEASQCKISTALIPIVRGERLMLVGDPEQLNPVVVLDTATNERLRKNYGIVEDEYDYCTNSIYQTYTQCDFVSDVLLLSSHYRSHPQIIRFCNDRYYNRKLRVRSTVAADHPLVFIDLKDTATDFHNTSPAEVDRILELLDQPAFADKSIGIITPFVNQMDCIRKALARHPHRNVTAGTVHKFQGDEKDVIIFSLAITKSTKPGTYTWLKNNEELINVAASRPRESLVLVGDGDRIEQLHDLRSDSDDLYALLSYVRSNGESPIPAKPRTSRALGFKPYSSRTEEAFKESLAHALGVVLKDIHTYSVMEKVKIADVFRSPSDRIHDLFSTGHFDFVVYRNQGAARYPVLAFELDGTEHFDSDTVKARDTEKNAICREQGLDLIRIENTYARRYYAIKEILTDYFINKEECENHTLDEF